MRSLALRGMVCGEAVSKDGERRRNETHAPMTNPDLRLTSICSTHVGSCRLSRSQGERFSMVC